jgi:hypothetical protein
MYYLIHSRLLVRVRGDGSRVEMYEYRDGAGRWLADQWIADCVLLGSEIAVEVDEKEAQCCM